MPPPVRLLLLPLVVLTLAWAGAQPAAAQPNFVVIVFDDLGVGDFGAYGGTEIATPEVDALAAEGMRFTRGYAPAASCSAARAGLLTGRHPAAFGLRRALRIQSERGLPGDARGLAAVLGDAGYATGHFGKWHLGTALASFLPAARGFDRSVVISGGPGTYYFDKNYLIDGDLDFVPGHSTTVTTDFAIEFIEESADAAEPFFANVWYNAPHRPYEPLPEWAAEYPDTEDGRYSALVAHADAEIGRIVQTLADRGLADTTLVLVTSDNGAGTGSGSNGSLRGHKRQVFEGGIRAPWIARWPGTVAAGVTNGSILVGADLLPTLAALAGAPGGGLALDGRDRSRALLESAELGRPEPLYWETKLADGYFAPVPGSDGWNRWAVRHGPWKLVHENNPGVLMLFDVASDPDETVDLAAAEPDRVAELLRTYADLRRRTGRVAHRVRSLAPGITRDAQSGGWLFGGGASGAVELVEDVRFDFHDGDFSASAEIVLASLTGADQVVAEKPGSWRLFVDAAGRAVLEVEGDDPSETTRLESLAALSPGVRHELAFTVFGWIDSPSTIRLYVDGVLQTETNEVERVAVARGPVFVGNAGAGGAPFGGVLSALTFDLLGLSPDEVRDRDGDGAANLDDNCRDTRNPGQTDVDADGTGNACDGDFDQSGWVDVSDEAVLAMCLGRVVAPGVGPTDDPTCGESDMDGDGQVGAPDYALLQAVWSPRPPPRGCGVGAGALAVACALCLVRLRGRRRGR